MAQTDRDILLVLYRSTDGPNWTWKEGWNTGADLSKWHGVKVYEGRVITLYLCDNNLRGTIPLELGNLRELHMLSLCSNKLTGFIPPELGKLAALQRLSLSDNQLTGAIPAQLGALNKLVVLNLSNNQLSGHTPKDLGALSMLQTLWLNGNQLTGPIPPELGNLAALQYFYLANNELSGLWDTLGQGSMATRPGTLPEALCSLLDSFERLGPNLDLGQNPWEHPPEPIVAGGMRAVRSYFEAMYKGGTTAVSRPLKVVIVGKETVGKTSLRRSIKTGRPCMTSDGGAESTVHVDVECHDVDGNPIRMFDCAGQVVYYGLLQLFLTPRAVYLLVWDAAEASEMDDLDIESLAIAPWLRYLTFRVPDANVVLVGNKCDRVEGNRHTVAAAVERRSRQWLKAWIEKARGRHPHEISLEERVSLTSCKPSGLGLLAPSFGGGAGTGWPCDKSSPGLLGRIVRNGAGDTRAVTMCLPLSYQLALGMLEELASSSRGEVEHQTPGITRASLEKKWLAKVDELSRAGTPVAAPEAAMSGAILIRKWEGGLVEYGSFIFLDVQWFATVLDPLFSHKRDLFGNIELGGITVKNEASLDRLDKTHVLEPQLAEELWGAELAPHLLLALKSAGLTFPLPKDPNRGLVILSRMDAKPPDDYSTKLNSRLRQADQARKHDLRLLVECSFSLGLPPGFIERLLARCCHLGFPYPFWRYGALIVDDSAEEGLFSVSMRYSEKNKILTVEVYGGCRKVHGWAALSKVLSVMIKMLAEFPGLPCQATFFCPLHETKGMPIRTTDAQPGSRLVEESYFCPLCQDRPAGIDHLAVALQVVEFSDDEFFDAQLHQHFTEHAEEVARQGRALWPGGNFEVPGPAPAHPSPRSQAPLQSNSSSPDSGTPWYQDVRTWIAAASATCLTIFGVLKEDGDSSVWGVFLGLAILLLVVDLVLIARVKGMLCLRAEVASAGNEPAGGALA